MSKTEYSKKHFMFNKRLHGAYILAGFAVQSITGKFTDFSRVCYSKHIYS